MAGKTDTHNHASLWQNAIALRLSELPRAAVIAIGLLLVTAIAFLDLATGPRVLLSIFYLLPVMLVAWATGSTSDGLIIVAASCLVGPIEGLITGYQDTSVAISIWNSSVRLEVFLIVLVLMSRVRMVMEQAQEQAVTDELTGVANLRGLREIVAKEVERSRRFGHPVTLAYIDIDKFKSVNDRAGHEAGDRVLISLATTAGTATRSVDTVARVGGDEFVVLMPETGQDAALLLADRLRDVVARTIRVGEVPVTCSIGLACFERPPRSVDELLATADELMYQAKAKGGNEVQSLVLAGPHLVKANC